MKRFLLVIFVSGLACEPADIGSTIEPLERVDVEDLPPGSATGSRFAGDYLFLDFSLDACTCSKADPALFDCDQVGIAAGSVEVNHEEGRLEFVPIIEGERAGEFWLTGGVETDGSFTVGGVTPAIRSGEVVGETLQRAVGVFADPELAFTLENRVRMQFDGSSVDCTAEMSLRAVRQEGSVMPACVFDDDCPSSDPHCVDGTCENGLEGASCRTDFDCPDETLVCIDDQCRPRGGIGDPCTLGSHCQPGLWCSLERLCEAM